MVSVEGVALAHAAATWYMVGVIWLVQVVHYPLFEAVGRAEFAAYERRNTFLTGLVVGPPMLVEAVTALWLVATRPGALALVGAVLLAVIWVTTAALSVPAHARLEQGFDARTLRRLVASNWARTAAWTARGAVALLLLTGA